MDYKKPLSIENQIHYLEQHKNVKVVDEDYAKLTLTKFSYFNFVTPFKHNFAEKKPNTRFECKRSKDGKHYYNNQVDFSKYEELFYDERQSYYDLYSGIHKFELIYKSLVINRFLVKHNIVNSTIAVNILNVYKNRIPDLVIHTMGGEAEKKVRRNQMGKIFDNLIKQVSGYYRSSNHGSSKNAYVEPVDIYLVLDRMNLSQTNALYFCMKNTDRLDIYRQMTELGVNLGSKDHIDFLKRVFNLVSIRNAIMHFNSLTILLKYSDYKKKKYRTNTSINQYEAIIRSLSYINKNINFKVE